MTTINSSQSLAIAKFRTMHESGCFLMPNPWDRGTAIYLTHLGFKALASTSAGFAFSQGLSDKVTAVHRDRMIAHIRDIVTATPLPVNADFQSGYADEPEEVALNVARGMATGIAGLSIEDASGKNDAPLYDLNLAIARIKAARQTIDESEMPIILTARCEAWLVGMKDPFRIALDRLVAYADAGADCLFAPGVFELKEIQAIVKAVAPKPVNIILSKSIPNLSLPKLTELGVRRISVGSALARVAWGAFMKAAQDIATTGTFDTLADAVSFKELNQIFDV